jgi:regulatory protein YycH of two-component signal transduction system YycFG
MKPFYYTPKKNNPTNQNPPKTKTQHKTNPNTKKLLSTMNPFHMTIDDDHTDTTQVH